MNDVIIQTKIENATTDQVMIDLRKKRVRNMQRILKKKSVITSVDRFHFIKKNITFSYINVNVSPLFMLLQKKTFKTTISISCEKLKSCHKFFLENKRKESIFFAFTLNKVVVLSDE